MILFALASYRDLAGDLARADPSLHLGDFTLERFTNGELHVELKTPVGGAECAVLGTLRPPEQHLGEFLLLCDTLRRCGARSIVALLPYFAYSRQDRAEDQCSRGAAWIGQLLAASGATHVLTLDVHSPQVAALCPIPLTSLDAAALLVPALEGLGADTTLIAPDEGAIERCQRFQQIAGLARFAHFNKVRSKSGVRSHLVGPVSEHAVVLDDILDTGATLIACARGLRAAGVRQIAVAVTHGLFTTGTAWPQLWELGVDRIVCTDSLGSLTPPDRRIKVVSCAPALSSALHTFTASRPAPA